MSVKIKFSNGNSTTIYSGQSFYNENFSSKISDIQVGLYTAALIVSIPIWGKTDKRMRGTLVRNLAMTETVAFMDFNYWPPGSIKPSIAFSDQANFYENAVQLDNLDTVFIGYCNDNMQFQFAFDGNRGVPIQPTGFCLRDSIAYIFVSALPNATQYFFDPAYISSFKLDFQCIPGKSYDEYINEVVCNGGKYYYNFTSAVMTKKGSYYTVTDAYAKTLDYCNQCEIFKNSFNLVCNKTAVLNDGTSYCATTSDFCKSAKPPFKKNCRDYNWVLPIINSLSPDDLRRITIPELENAVDTYNKICTIEQQGESNFQQSCDNLLKNILALPASEQKDLAFNQLISISTTKKDTATIYDFLGIFPQVFNSTVFNRENSNSNTSVFVDDKLLLPQKSPIIFFDNGTMQIKDITSKSFDNINIYGDSYTIDINTSTDLNAFWYSPNNKYILRRSAQEGPSIYTIYVNLFNNSNFNTFCFSSKGIDQSGNICKDPYMNIYCTSFHNSIPRPPGKEDKACICLDKNALKTYYGIDQLEEAAADLDNKGVGGGDLRQTIDASASILECIYPACNSEISTNFPNAYIKKNNICTGQSYQFCNAVNVIGSNSTIDQSQIKAFNECRQEVPPQPPGGGGEQTSSGGSTTPTTSPSETIPSDGSTTSPSETIPSDGSTTSPKTSSPASSSTFLDKLKQYKWYIISVGVFLLLTSVLLFVFLKPKSTPIPTQVSSQFPFTITNQTNQTMFPDPTMI
jgi:hypothetical protein